MPITETLKQILETAEQKKPADLKLVDNKVLICSKCGTPIKNPSALFCSNPKCGCVFIKRIERVKKKYHIHLLKEKFGQNLEKHSVHKSH